jgi:hypothetical protein
MLPQETILNSNKLDMLSESMVDRSALNDFETDESEGLYDTMSCCARRLIQ